MAVKKNIEKLHYILGLPKAKTTTNCMYKILYRYNTFSCNMLSLYMFIFVHLVGFYLVETQICLPKRNNYAILKQE
jgi:hypothetical protein